MTGILRALGGKVVPSLSRMEGGYGFSEALRKSCHTGATLLVTCDCGSSDHERLAQAKAKGIDCLVIDHHLVPKEPLPAVAFLKNPTGPIAAFLSRGSLRVVLRSHWGRPYASISDRISTSSLGSISSRLERLPTSLLFRGTIARL